LVNLLERDEAVSSNSLLHILRHYLVLPHYRQVHLNQDEPIVYAEIAVRTLKNDSRLGSRRDCTVAASADE